MRSLPRPTGNVFLGDVVAFRPPPGMDGSLLVRRIAAVEGEEMVSDDPEDTAFTLPSGAPSLTRSCVQPRQWTPGHAELPHRVSAECHACC